MDGVQISQSLAHQSLDTKNQCMKNTEYTEVWVRKGPNSDWRWSGVAGSAAVLKNQLILECGCGPLSPVHSLASDSRNDGSSSSALKLDGVDAILGGTALAREPPKAFCIKRKEVVDFQERKADINWKTPPNSANNSVHHHPRLFCTTWQLFFMNKKLVSGWTFEIFQPILLDLLLGFFYRCNLA